MPYGEAPFASVASLVEASGRREEAEVVAVIGCDSSGVCLAGTSFARDEFVGGELDSLRLDFGTVDGETVTFADEAEGVACSAMAGGLSDWGSSSSAMPAAVLVEAIYEDCRLWLANYVAQTIRNMR